MLSLYWEQPLDALKHRVFPRAANLAWSSSTFVISSTPMISCNVHLAASTVLQTQVYAPSQSRQTAHQSSNLDALDDRKIEEADQRPQLPTRKDQTPEVVPHTLYTLIPCLTTQSTKSDQEDQRIDTSPEGLIECEFSERVTFGEFGFVDLRGLLFAIEFFLVVFGGGVDGRVRGDKVS